MKLNLNCIIYCTINRKNLGFGFLIISHAAIASDITVLKRGLSVFLYIRLSSVTLVHSAEAIAQNAMPFTTRYNAELTVVLLSDEQAD